MKLPKIVQAGHPVLRQVAAPVAEEDLGSQKLKSLVSIMIAVMRDAPGVGLAAPQIGISQQVIVLEDSEELMAGLSPSERDVRGRVPFDVLAIVNPKLTVHRSSIASPSESGRVTFFEGCLSVQGYMALVEREFRVEVTGVDPEGKPIHWEATGWPARILQHEIDHIHGVLYVDRMFTRSFCCNEEAKGWIGRPVDEVRAALGT